MSHKSIRADAEMRTQLVIYGNYHITVRPYSGKYCVTKMIVLSQNLPSHYSLMN